MKDEDIMRLALGEAKQALDHNDLPIGAVLVIDGHVISQRHNERELASDPTSHAELLVIRDVTKSLGLSRLDGATLFSTLEPCIMCAGAAWLARIKRVVFGADDPKAGALGSLYNVGADARLNHEFEVTPGILQHECAELLKSFFQGRR